MWITNVDSDVLNDKSSIAEAMDYLGSRGFNVIYPVVWNKGYTLYPSATMDSLFGLPQDPFFAAQQRDPLAEIIVEAHRNGMEVIPWFEYGFATSFSQNGGHILAAKPEWSAIDKDGKLVVRNGFDWMNPLHPEVQAFMLDLFREVIENYDVDGVQGDDRLPAMPVEGGYSEYTKELFRQEHGGRNPTTINIDPTWIQWRSDKLTNFGGKLYRMVKAHDPELTVSMSPSVWPWGRQNYLQDWPAWVDSGYVDIVHPQVYRYDLTSYQNEIRRLWGNESGTTSGYVDASQEALISPGLIVKAGSRFNSPAQITEMMRFNRNYAGGGEVFFFYEGLREQNEFLGDSLFATFYQTPAIMPNRDQLWRPLPDIFIPTNPNIELEGSWEADTTLNGYRSSPLVAPAGSDAAITHTLQAPYTATYDLYTFVPAGIAREGSTNLNIRYTDPNQVARLLTIDIDENTAGWIRLANVSFNQGDTFTLTYETDPNSSAPTYVDATMLMLNRGASPGLKIETIITSNEIAQFASGQPVLQANYPNPFSTSTTIPFHLAAPSTVELTVYDMLGREVQRLIKGGVYSAGQHSVSFDGLDLPSGLYFYRLQTKLSSSTKSMILIR